MLLKRAAGAGAAALVLVCGCITGAPAARADNPGIQISITQVSPTVWQPGDELVMTGSVTNTTSSNLAGLRAVMWQSTTPITTLADFDEVVASSNVTQPAGLRRQNDVRGVQPLSSTIGDILAAGTTASFTLSGTPDLPTSGAAYLVGVQVINRQGQVLARARLMLGCLDADQPVAVAVVVPLTSTPSLVHPAVKGDTPSPAVFRDDHLANDLAGSLGDMINLAEHPGVTALIDPTLVDELTAMSAGYVVTADDGTGPVDGTGQAAAEDALQRIDALIARGDAYRLPANNPDLNAVAALPQPVPVMALATSIDDASPLAQLPLAVLVLGEGLTPAAQQLLTTVAPDIVVTNTLDPSNTTQEDTDHQLWVATTSVAKLNDIAGPQPDFFDASGVRATTSRLARLIVAASSNAPTVVLSGDENDIAAVSSWMDDGWQPQTLSDIVAGLPTSSMQLVSQPPTNGPPAALISTVANISDQLSLWADIGAVPDNATATAYRLLPGVFATAWNDWTAANAWLTQAADQLGQQVGKGTVTLRIAGEWHLSSKNNRLPITIVNTMGIPVRVRVHFTSENAGRLNVPNSELITVEAGSTASIVVTPLPAGNGSVEVTATLLTASGTLIGDPVYVQVVTTSAGRLAWAIIVGAGVAFVIATSLRVRQVRRQRAVVKEVPPAAEPDDIDWDDYPTLIGLPAVERVHDFEPTTQNQAK